MQLIPYRRTLSKQRDCEISTRARSFTRARDPHLPRLSHSRQYDSFVLPITQRQSSDKLCPRAPVSAYNYRLAAPNTAYIDHVQLQLVGEYFKLATTLFWFANPGPARATRQIATSTLRTISASRTISGSSSSRSRLTSTTRATNVTNQATRTASARLHQVSSYKCICWLQHRPNSNN